ncbi:hypothetical protein ACTFIU_007978 [Dictyostelium citrinum]
MTNILKSFLTRNTYLNKLSISTPSYQFNKYYSTTISSLPQSTHSFDKKQPIENVDNKKYILTDKFNRHHTYLRISLTERCNLRCKYCMPEEGVMLSQADKILTSDEIIRLSKLFVSAGVNKIRFTGGEPLVRKDVEPLIEEVGKIKGLEKIGITTNGILLNRKLDRLHKAGVNLLNISLDTLDSDKFTLITRRLGWDRVFQSIDNALELDNIKVKVNCVIMKGLNDMEICDFVEMTRNKAVEIRFIEYMPFDGNLWSDKKFLAYTDMIKIIHEKYPTFKKYTIEEEEPNNTSKTYHVPGFKGKVGFITSMSEHFCSSCNRLRITADGNLKVCLFGNTEVNLRDRIREGASDQQLLEIINAAVLKKKASHADKYKIQKNFGYSIKQKKEVKHYLLNVIYSSLNNFENNKNNPKLQTQHRNYSTINNNNNNNNNINSNENNEFSHITKDGKLPTMVDISDKIITKRTAHAQSILEFPSNVLSQLLNLENGFNNNSSNDNNNKNKNNISNNKEIISKKGPVFATSIIAGTMAVKNTSNLIPFCHPIPIESCKIDITIIDSTSVKVDCIVSMSGKTGVEMEALTGATVASLTIYDMCKALSKEIVIKETKLISKFGGKSSSPQITK